MLSQLTGSDLRAASEVLSLWEIRPIISTRRGDEEILRFMSVPGACVIRDHISHASPVHQHINQPISISLMRGWEGSALWPRLVTLGFRMDRGGGAGTDTGSSWIMDDFSRAFSIGRPVYISRENLPDKWPSRRKVAYSEELMVNFSDVHTTFNMCTKSAGNFHSLVSLQYIKHTPK